MTTTIRPCGPRAVLVETDRPLAMASGLRTVAGVDEVVPGACTVLVMHQGSFDLASELAREIERIAESAAVAPQGGLVSDTSPSSDRPPVVIDVAYDGPDLDEVAELAGITVEEVIEMHTSTVYVSAFCGFAPGFAYLEGLPSGLHVPRRATPRTRVPAGSVAIAGPYTAVYPGESPGGWRLLGHTQTIVWDAESDPPALLTPGLRVRFRAVGATSRSATT